MPPPPSSPPPPKLAAMQFNFKVTPEIIAPTHYIPCDDGAFGLSFIGELLLVLCNDVRGRKENRRGKGEMRGLSPNPNFVSGTSCMQQCWQSQGLAVPSLLRICYRQVAYVS